MATFISAKTKAIKFCLFENRRSHLNTQYNNVSHMKVAERFVVKFTVLLDTVYFDDRCLLVFFLVTVFICRKARIPHGDQLPPLKNQ